MRATTGRGPGLVPLYIAGFDRVGVPMAVGVGLTFGLPVAAGTILHTVPDSTYRSIATQDPFTSTGYFTTYGSTFASGTLIDDQWVLTAAHVVDSVNNLAFHIDGRAYAAESYVTTAGWSGNALAGNDLALVRLAAPVTADTAYLYTGPISPNVQSVQVGYGSTGTGLTGYVNGSAGTGRAGTNTIDDLLGNVLLTDFDDPFRFIDTGTLGSDEPTAYEIAAAPGDSGGGLYVYVDSQWRLAAVTSFVAGIDGSADADYGDYSGYTAIHNWSGWIDGVLFAGSSAQLASIAASVPSAYTYGSFPVTLVPEPALAALSASGFALSLRRRRPV